MIDQQKLLAGLTERLDSIELPEAAMDGGPSNDGYALAQIQTSIIARFGEWIGDYTDLLPPKDVVLELLEKAIDAAMVALKAKHPVLVRVFGPAAKVAIIRAASALYDSILNPQPEVQV